jgi:hypothetical protein
MHLLWAQQKRIFSFCFVQEIPEDLLYLDTLNGTDTIGSLDNGDGQVSVRRSYAFFPEGFTHELKMD